MLPMKWDNDKLSLGISLVDEQHKQLFNIINQLVTINANSKKKDILYVIDKFINYTRFHFSTEENLFDKFDYLDSTKHKIEHQEFIEKFEEIIKELKNKKSYKQVAVRDIADKLYSFITNWIINHITDSDKEYSKLVKENKKIVEQKDITVLYVEDKIEVREYFTKILKLKTKNVHAFSNGHEALSFFKEKKADIDLILSDIDMPSLNGIELLKQVRAIDNEIPYIIISAFLEPEHLFEAISNNVTAYFRKPININQLFKKIDNFFYQKVNQLKQKYQRYEIETYLDALDHVAIVSKIDLEGKFTYINDIYCEVSKYKREELIGKYCDLILHPDTSKEMINEIKKVVQSGNKWQGRIKNIAKDRTSFYVSMTIFPLYDNDDNEISGYMIIKFLITDLVEEKREFRKNIVSNLLDYKKKQFDLSKKVTSLEEDLLISNKKTDFYKEKKQNLKKKYKKSLDQIEFFEKSIKEKDLQYQKIFEVYKTNIQKLNNIYKNLSKESEKNKKEISILKDDQSIRAKEIIKLNEKLNEQAKIIGGLRDTIKNIDIPSKPEE